jgi:hypothetical protein
MANLVNEVDFSELGLKIYDARSGEDLKSAHYYSTEGSGNLYFKVQMEKPLLTTDSKIGVCVDVASDSKLITIGEVTTEEKTIDFFYLYTIKVESVASSGANVVTFSGTTEADINRLRLLDYDHRWEKSELKNGTREYKQYFFDNTSTTDTDGNNIFDDTTASGIAARRLFYAGKMQPDYTGSMFQSVTYPIVDFFHQEFIYVIENKSMVWMRRKAGGGVDKLTWGDGYEARNPNGADIATDGGKQTVIPDTNYVVKTARTKDTLKRDLTGTGNMVVYDRTKVQRTSNVLMQPTMAKFVGWPYCGIEAIGADTYKYSDAQPFFFLKPSLDEDGNAMTDWDADDTEVYAKTVFYVNGAHAIPKLDVTSNGQVSTNASGSLLIEDRYYTWEAHQPAETLTVSSTAYCWTPNMQEIAGVGAQLIPGDGNEYYNCKFWRNDGDSFSAALTLDSRQGLIFDNCDFESTWDGYTDDYTGSTELSPALLIKNNSYDNVFTKCNFRLNTVMKEVAYTHWMHADQGGNQCAYHEYNTDFKIFGARDTRADGRYDGGIVVSGQGDNWPDVTPTGNTKIGDTSAILVEDSGNIKFDTCTFKANFAQDCVVCKNADNVDILGCDSETYYHNTEVLYSKYYPSNISDYDNSVYDDAKLNYEGTLSMYEIFVEMFAGEANIMAALAGGDRRNWIGGQYVYKNDWMNGKLGSFSYSTIEMASESITSKNDAQELFETESELKPFKIDEKFEFKPKGFWFTSQSSSVTAKGSTFYGEGIGFYASDLTNSHYLEYEDNRVDTYIDEAYLFRNVNYPKLRGCWGHTISHSVFKFQSCYKPTQYDCEAESDTGFGFEFTKGEATVELTEPYPTDMWRVYDCHVYSGSGLEYDPDSMPAKIDFGTFIQTANSTQDTYVLPEASGIERSLVGIKLYDAPYKAAFRNIYFRNIKNDIDIFKGDNVELYLENAHFAANREIHGTYSSPAYFIHKGFSGVWEYRDIGGSITTSAVYKEKNDNLLNDTSAGFSLSFKSHINNPLGRSTVVLGNSNDETQYLDLVQGMNKVEIFVMARLLDVEKPLTNQDIWLELRYKDRAPGDPHVTTATTRGDYDNIERVVIDETHNSKWKIKGELVPNAKEFKITMFVDAGQDCSCPLSICYEYFTTVGEIYVDPYARLVQIDDAGVEVV